MTAQTLGLLAALAWPLPMIVALFMVVRAPALKFRLIWVAFCFVGVGAFWMDTATGHWGFIPAAINILGPGSAPGFFKACIPIGAFVVIAMLQKIKAIRAAALAAKAAEPPSA